MSFLPQILCSPKKKPGPHLPTDHVGPLINQQWKIAVRLDPGFISIPNDGFTRWPYNEFFFQFGFRVYDNTTTVWIIFQPVMGNNRTFLCEPFHMRCFPAKKTFGYKEWEIGIFMSCIFKHL